MDGVEFYGRCSLLKAGLTFADALTTVSPTYAEEIQQEGLGMGMQDLVRKRRAVLSGILNGIDTETWNPAADIHIPSHYDAATLEHFRKCALSFGARIGFHNAVLAAAFKPNALGLLDNGDEGIAIRDFTALREEHLDITRTVLSPCLPGRFRSRAHGLTNAVVRYKQDERIRTAGCLNESTI